MGWSSRIKASACKYSYIPRLIQLHIHNVNAGSCSWNWLSTMPKYSAFWRLQLEASSWTPVGAPPRDPIIPLLTMSAVGRVHFVIVLLEGSEHWREELCEKETVVLESSKMALIRGSRQHFRQSPANNEDYVRCDTSTVIVTLFNWQWKMFQYNTMKICRALASIK